MVEQMSMLAGTARSWLADEEFLGFTEKDVQAATLKLQAVVEGQVEFLSLMEEWSAIDEECEITQLRTTEELAAEAVQASAEEDLPPADEPPAVARTTTVSEAVNGLETDCQNQ